MMEDQPPLTSLDGFSNRNPPQRCPHPLDSQDPTQEGYTTPHHDQSANLKHDNIVVKQEYKEEDKKYSVMEEFSDGHKSMMETPNNRIPPEICPCPLDSHVPTPEGHTIPHHDQGEEMKDIKVQIKEKETLVRETPQSMDEGGTVIKVEKEKSSLHTDTNRHYVRNNTDGHLILLPANFVKFDAIPQCSSEVNQITDHTLHPLKTSRDPSNPEESSDPSCTVTSDVLLSHTADSSTYPSNSKEPSRSKVKIKSKLHKHLSLNILTIPCSECGKCFSSKKALYRHQIIHTDNCPYSCSECGKCFTKNQYLQRHQKIHTGECPYSCSECGKRFKEKNYLLSHQRIHSGERPYSCSECGKSFIRNIHLRYHLRIHTGERPYSCSECGKQFAVKSGLVYHWKIHTGERPYSCSECGKSFTTKEQLNMHHALHTGERPFSCSECGKCFTRKKNLQNHHRVHTGERPFLCSECGKYFTQKRDLRNHQRIHTE